MLQDSRLRSELEEMIRQRHYSPEYAVSRTLRRYAQVFQRLESSYLAERANDIFDIEKRLLRHLLGRRREGIAHLTSPVLVLAHNLTPSETANLDRRFVRGFVTEIGGPGSHTAIVAEALEIPAVVGTGPFLTEVSGGELVIIDGDKGLVILQPDEETLARYRHEAEEIRTQAAQARSRSAICRPKRSTACASNCWATSSFPTRSITASIAGPTAWACTAPSSSTSAARPSRPRRSISRRIRRVVRDDGREAGDDPHVRPGGRQDAAPCRRPRTSAIRASGCGASAWRCATCRCSARSCARRCGPAPGQRADHVPAGLHAAGTAAGENGAGRRDGRPRGARHRRSTATCRWA